MGVCSIPAIRPGDYEALQSLVADLPGTFEEWVAFQVRDVKVAQQAGDVAELIYIDPEAFKHYRQAQGPTASLSDLYRFAAHLICAT